MIFNCTQKRTRSTENHSTKRFTTNGYATKRSYDNHTMIIIESYAIDWPLIIVKFNWLIGFGVFSLKLMCVFDLKLRNQIKKNSKVRSTWVQWYFPVVLFIDEFRTSNKCVFFIIVKWWKSNFILYALRSSKNIVLFNWCQSICVL